jgi:hypothetical protein
MATDYAKKYSTEKMALADTVVTPEDERGAQALAVSPEDLRALEDASIGAAPDSVYKEVAGRMGQRGMSDSRVPSGITNLDAFNLPGSPRTGNDRFTPVKMTVKSSALDMGDMIDAFQKYTKANVGIAKLLEEAGTKGNEASVAAANAATLAGATDVTAINAKGVVDVGRAAANQRDMNLLGLDSADPQSRFIELQRQRMDAVKVKNALRDRIDTEDAIMIYDDPLRWAVNQFTLPALKTTFNAASRKEQAAADEISRTNAIAASRQALDLSVTADSISKRVAAEAAQASAKAAVEAARISMQGIHLQTQTLMQRSAVNNSNQQARIAEASLLARYTEQVETDKATAYLAPFIDLENMRRQSVGAQPITTESLKLMSKEQKADLVQRGNLAAGQLSTSPGETLQYLRYLGADVVKTQPALALTLQRQLQSDEFQTEMQRRMIEPKFAALPYDQQQATVLDAVYSAETTSRHKTGNYDKLPNSSPYKLILGNATQLPELKDNLFTPEIQKLLDGKKPGQTLTPQEVEGTAVAMILSGKHPAEVAKALSEFNRTLAVEQWSRSGAAAAGFERPSDYKTSTMQTSGAQVDQYKPADIEHWLMTKLAAHNSRVLGMQLFDYAATGVKSFQETTAAQVAAQQTQYQKDLEDAKKGTK